MLKKLLFLILINLSFISTAFSYNELYVQDPQLWYRDQGTIEEVNLSVQPKGLYMEYGLYITFSAKNGGFSNSDTLEVVYNFDLPENSIVTDSWLWIGDEIIRGEIMDKWTATIIYEGIVNRRKDPSILRKMWRNQYELRIFPMAGDESRKVKITYLVPNQWTANSVISPLPSAILDVSRNQINKYKLLSHVDDKWNNPSIIQFPDIEFTESQNDEFKNFMEADIPTDAINGSLNFTMNAPINDGVYVNTFQSDEENFYQLALLPSEALDIEQPRKVLILIDYLSGKSDESRESILNSIRTMLLTSFTDADSFNIAFSQLEISRLSETWLPSDLATIDTVFSSLDENSISNYSNLPVLLANGIDFVQTNGNDANILLVANSDGLSDSEAANELLLDLLDKMEPKLPIHVVDFQDRSFAYNWIGGREYFGNQYFYSNITRMTTANYHCWFDTYSKLPELLNKASQSFNGFISSFDLHTKMEAGFCYGRFDIGNLPTSSIYLDRAIMQVGKFTGASPFIIEVSGVFDNEPFSKQVSISETELDMADSVSDQIWSGNYISRLEEIEQTNEVVSLIVDHSINSRVLSIYSAFLCLEPSMGGEVCYDCFDDGDILIGVDDEEEEVESDSVSVAAYPNPFNGQTKINVTLPSVKNLENVTLKIYNILGQVVKTFSTDGLTSKSFQLDWNGRNDNNEFVSTGTYIFSAITPNKNYSIKLLYLK